MDEFFRDALGGKDNDAADRELAQKILTILPGLPSGSYLVLTHSTPDDVRRGREALNHPGTAAPSAPRPRTETIGMSVACRGHREHTGYMGRIIGTILGAILAIWLVVTTASGIFATFKTFLIIGLIAMVVFTVVWLVARLPRRD
jgi:predicted lipid-binding transport protein (Tim44 family)